MPKPYIVRDIPSRDRLAAHILGLQVDGKVWEVSIAPYRQKRTSRQNRLAFAWIDEVVSHVNEYSGQDKSDIYEFFKRKFLAPKRVQVGDEAIEYYTTKNLTTKEFSAWTDAIHAWVSSELGIILPLPEDQGR